VRTLRQHDLFEVTLRVSEPTASTKVWLLYTLKAFDLVGSRVWQTPDRETMQTFVVRAVQPGEHELRFHYTSPWRERDALVEEVWSEVVQVLERVPIGYSGTGEHKDVDR
jgi:predicted secreted protein